MGGVQKEGQDEGRDEWSWLRLKGDPQEGEENENLTRARLKTLQEWMVDM